jgi:uncharacterized protein with PIN domain
MGPDAPDVRFACDAMLGGMARWLRAAGYDASFRHGIDDGALVALAEAERAVLLSSDRPLFDRRPMRTGAVRGIFVPRHARPLDQAVFVLHAVGLGLREVRCMACGGALAPIAREAVAHEAPPGALALETSFYRCTRCDRLYWEGTHWARIAATRAEIARRLAAVASGAASPSRAQHVHVPRPAPSPISPLGAGMTARRLRISSAGVLRLGALLAGYDHLASLHDAPDGSTLVVTTDDRAAELDDILEELRPRIPFEVLPLP